jgi:hypothetical protein
MDEIAPNDMRRIDLNDGALCPLSRRARFKAHDVRWGSFQTLRFSG